MKRLFAVALCLSIAISLLTGCDTGKDPYVPTGNGLAGATQPTGSKDPATDQEEDRLTLVYDPRQSLNPYTCMDTTNRVLFSLIYQGLFTVDRDYNVFPVLCKSYNVSEDMKTYTFHIAAARFSDGTAMTAADVAASLQAAKKSSWYGGRLKHVRSVSSYGDAVVVELSTAMENLPLLLDIPVVKAAQVNDDAPLGTGPYQLSGDQLRRQAGWWCSAELSIHADTIRLVEGTSAAQIRDAFEQEHVSLVCADPAARDYVEYHNDYELWDSENGLFVYLACNEKSKIFGDIELRSALLRAIDRDALVNECYRGFAQSAALPCSPRAPYYDRTLASNYGYVPQVLRNAVEKAELTGTEVVLLVNGDDATRIKVAQAVAEMLEESGLKVTVKRSSSKAFAQDLKAGKYDLYLAQTRLSANMDLSAFFAEDGSLSYGGLSDPGLYHISLEALANRGNYYTLYEMVMDDAMLCPLLFQSYALYCQRGSMPQLSPARDHIFYYDLGRTMEDALLRE